MQRNWPVGLGAHGSRKGLAATHWQLPISSVVSSGRCMDQAKQFLLKFFFRPHAFDLMPGMFMPFSLPFILGLSIFERITKFTDILDNFVSRRELPRADFKGDFDSLYLDDSLGISIAGRGGVVRHTETRAHADNKKCARAKPGLKYCRHADGAP
jgi:hypothetical protein